MQKINFQDLPSTTTPINATNLNAIQTNAETEINKAIKTNDASILASVTPINITPTAGSNYAPYGNSFYYKIGTRVHVHLGLQGLTPDTNQYVATMPTGYIPYTALAIVGVGGSSSEVIGGQILVSGAISIRPVSQYALFDIEYDTFS